MIEKLDLNKKWLLAIFITFLLILLVYFLYLSNVIITMQDELGEAEEYYEQGLQEHSQLNDLMIFNYLDVIEESFDNYKDYSSGDNFIEGFRETILKPQEMSATYFVIMAFENTNGEMEKVFDGHLDQRYHGLSNHFPREYTNKEISSFNIENETVFYSARKLSTDDINITIYVGYTEEVVEDEYIISADINNLMYMQSQMEQLIYITGGFVFIAGILVIFTIIKLQSLRNTLTIQNNPEYWNMYLLANYINCNGDLNGYFEKSLEKDDFPDMEEVISKITSTIKKGNDD